MSKFLSLFLGFFIIGSLIHLEGQKVIKNSSITGVCYAGTKVKRIFIPPPAEFYNRTNAKKGGSVKVYTTGFSNQGKAAIEYAASILASMLPADTRITILADWSKISTAGVLGHSSITSYIGGWGIDAEKPEAFYPIALAEKIYGDSLNTAIEGDITLTINSTTNWYLGIDGLVPKGSNKFDLVTVALHELCHGIGFFDSMNTDETTGWWGVSSLPAIYDSFVENLKGEKIIDTTKFKNYSPQLLNQLTSGQLFFNGPLLRKFTDGKRAQLYDPPTWEAGSSVSHLDEEPVTLQENALMTPFIDREEVIHDPGKYTFSILGDLGWINTRIIHKKITDTEENISQVTLNATVKSDTTYNRNKVGLVYSYNMFVTCDTVYMTSPNTDNNFSAILSIPVYNTQIQYYMFVQDCFLRTYRSPSLVRLFKNTFYVGSDTVKPVIIHTPVKYYFETIDTVRFKADVTDNIGVDTVYVEYKVNNGLTKFLGLKAGLNGSYANYLNARNLSLNGGDSVYYRIIAFDKSHNNNKAVFPSKGYSVTGIENIDDVVTKFETDFSGNASNDFFTDGFTISKPEGFSKFGLNSRHPYESPEDNSKTIEYSAMLRHPLKINESGVLVSYDEIVLVEPGETGSVFGSSDFYDYVILDASKDFGKTWFNMINGYDSRLYSIWETSYNGSITEQNSIFVPTESLIRNHKFLLKPSDKISAGDTMMIRFRLYSDPFANGWGWVVENLKIAPFIDAVETINKENIVVFPNPGKGLIHILSDKSDNLYSSGNQYKVLNSAGICIRNARTSGNNENVIDISDCSSGIYYIQIYRDDGLTTIKYTLIK
jgi:hypothetical protein